MNNKRLLIIIVLLSMTMGMMSQSLTVTQDVKVVPNSSVLALYKNQFGDWEKPDLDDTFPYVVIRIALEGNAREVKAAKQKVGLYLGTQTAVEAVYKDNENELLFLIPSRVRHVEITCGDGCEKQTIIDAMQLRSNMVYSGKVHYIPAEELGMPSIYQAPKRQFFKFFVTPTDASVRVMVDGIWQRWPVEEGMASKSLDHGKYKYEVTAENYLMRTGEIVVSDASSELTVNLEPRFGWLEIESNNTLDGAYVFATNTETSATQQLGQLPFAKVPQLDGGSYQIEIQKEKYKPFSSFVNILSGDTVQLYPQLVANYGEVILEVDGDTECEIYIDNQLLGKGRWVGTLEKGQYSVESRRAYHHSTYTNIDVASDMASQSFTLNAPLPIYGSLVIDGSPNVSDVYLDGEMVGKTPYIVNQVLAGPHKLRIEKKGYIPYEEEIVVDENGEKVVNYAMEKGSAPKVKNEEVVQPTVPSTTLAQRVDSAVGGVKSSETLVADVPVVKKKRMIMNTFLLFEEGFSLSTKTDSIVNKLSHGGMFGQAYNGVGWYIKGRSNFNFKKATYDDVAVEGGYLNGVLPYYSGKTTTSEWMIGGGLMLDFTSMGNREKKKKQNAIGVYLGAGYGKREVLWETTNRTWVKYGPNSYEGVFGDAGLMCSFGGLTISFGASTIGFKYMELHVGAGFTL